MDDRVLTMMLNDIERLEGLEKEYELKSPENIITIKALYEDFKEINEPGSNYIKSKVENLMFKSGAARAYVSVFTEDEIEMEERFVKVFDEFYKMPGNTGIRMELGLIKER